MRQVSTFVYVSLGAASKNEVETGKDDWHENC